MAVRVHLKYETAWWSFGGDGGGGGGGKLKQSTRFLSVRPFRIPKYVSKLRAWLAPDKEKLRYKHINAVTYAPALIFECSIVVQGGRWRNVAQFFYSVFVALSYYLKYIRFNEMHATGAFFPMDINAASLSSQINIRYLTIENETCVFFTKHA